MNSISIKNKRLIIIVFDVITASAAGFWASDTFPDYKSLIITSFFVFFVLRLVLDFTINTIEEELYQLHIKAKMNELKEQEVISSKIVESLENGDKEGYTYYSELKKKFSYNG